MNKGISRSFRPTIASTLFLCALAVLFAGLGTWQTRRAAEKTALEGQFQQAPRLPLAAAIERDERFARVKASGHYDTSRHILLDNRLWQGRGGVHVFTPFTTNDGRVILVDQDGVSIVDVLEFDEQEENVAYGRYRLAGDTEDVLARMDPTPRRLNTAPIPDIRA